MCRVVSLLVSTAIRLDTGGRFGHHIVIAGVMMPVTLTVFSQQVQRFRQAGSLCGEDRREQDCERASVHVILSNVRFAPPISSIDTS